MEKFVETIYTLCSKYDKQDVDKVLNILNEKDKREIELRYGTDLEHPKRSSEYTKENGKYFIYELLPKIQDMLKNKIFNENQKPKAVVKVKIKSNAFNISNQNKDIKKKEKKNLTLFELFKDVDEKHLKLLVNLLIRKYREVIFYRHTENLNRYRYFSDLGLKDYKKYDKLYDEAIVLLDGIVKDYHVSLSEKMNETDEIIKKSIKSLNDEQLEILNRVHGENLEVTLPRKLFSKKELINYDKAISCLTKLVEKEKAFKAVEQEKKSEEIIDVEKDEKVTKVEEEGIVEEIPISVYEYTPNDISFKNNMLMRYGYIIESNVFNINLSNIINESIKNYTSDIDRERFIISEIYNSIRLIVEENKLLKRKIDLLSF